MTPEQQKYADFIASHFSGLTDEQVKYLAEKLLQDRCKRCYELLPMSKWTNPYYCPCQDDTDMLGE